MLADLATARSGRSKRISSFDRSGRNGDAYRIEAGETKEIADISGAGVIRHIWVTISCNQDMLYPRKLVLRMYWDDSDQPSVEAPIGDFFGVGHAKVTSYQCAAFHMSSNPGNTHNAAMNCYLPMPFASRARITVENGCEAPVEAFYFYVDYDELDSVADDQLRFHAHWRRNNPCVPPTHQGDDPDVNLTDQDNYLILETKGRGHFVGCNLSIHNLHGGWWGEGDDMFMIDGAKWPPDLHGTGSEDYFSHAWGMQVQNAFLYHGVSYHNSMVEQNGLRWFNPALNQGINERITVYRFHINDPVIFHESLRFSIEHGHANDRCDDYSSTAYWYQALPHTPFPPLPGVADRLPRPDVKVYPADAPTPPMRSHSPSGTGWNMDHFAGTGLTTRE